MMFGLNSISWLAPRMFGHNYCSPTPCLVTINCSPPSCLVWILFLGSPQVCLATIIARLHHVWPQLIARLHDVCPEFFGSLQGCLNFGTYFCPNLALWVKILRPRIIFEKNLCFWTFLKKCILPRGPKIKFDLGSPLRKLEIFVR